MVRSPATDSCTLRHMRAHQLRSRTLRRGFRTRLGLGTPATDADEEQRSEEAPVPPLGPEHRVDGDDAAGVIDLLNPQPAIVVDTKELRRALAFGFAGGDTTGTLARALWRAPVAETDWSASCFAEGLFIPALLRSCMKLRFADLEPALDTVFLGRLLTHPPKDPDVIDFRHAILRELAENKEVRERFEKTYRLVYRLRELFESELEVFELDNKQRRLETLMAIRDAVESMATAYETCDSGLSRIHAFASLAKSNDAYLKLVELLDFDNHLAGVDLKIRIGADGRVRRFELTQVSENRGNRFYQSPLGRWVTRFILLFRGYFLGEGELVNRWVDTVFDSVAPLLPPMIQLLGEMEFYLSALAFKEQAEAKGLSVCFPDFIEHENENAWAIDALFNPLLYEQDLTPVTCDLSSENWETTTIVTGPNSGGKTRLLQAIAIAQMLGQCGMYVPARAARLKRASGLFVSLIYEARADQKEGRLGTELIRIRELFERAKPGYLIVLDELCSGTNPSEGEEIFRLVISLLSELRPSVFITTHFLQFAARLESEAEDGGMSFLQVELDEQERPTYRFLAGVAQTSLAHQTAARLGVTREELLELVRENCSENNSES